MEKVITEERLEQARREVELSRLKLAVNWAEARRMWSNLLGLAGIAAIITFGLTCGALAYVAIRWAWGLM